MVGQRRLGLEGAHHRAGQAPANLEPLRSRQRPRRRKGGGAAGHDPQWSGSGPPSNTSPKRLEDSRCR